MSTYYGYYCKDCKEETGHWTKNYDNQLELLMKYEKVMNEIEKESKGNIEFRFLGFDTDEDYPLDWLRKHRGHNICIRNEYGENQCK